MNIVDKVTTIGCMRRTAMKKPLKAPTAMPTPMPKAVQRTMLLDAAIGSIWEARTTLTSEMTAPAERSNPPERMTIVWPIAAMAEVVPPLDRNEMSK